MWEAPLPFHHLHVLPIESIYPTHAYDTLASIHANTYISMLLKNIRENKLEINGDNMGENTYPLAHTTPLNIHIITTIHTYHLI